MKRICIYHRTDLDGICSREIVRKFWEADEYLGLDYADEVPIFEKAHYCIVDFSFKTPIMLLLNSIAESVIWIDHHISAIKDMHGNIPEGWLGIRQTDKAACQLTWDFFGMSTPEPEAVTLLGNYDIWDHADPRVRPFQLGALAMQNDPYFWVQALTPDELDIDHICRIGGHIQHYLNAQNKKKLNNAYFTHFQEYTALCLNNTGGGSLIFDQHHQLDQADLLIGYFWTGANWRISLYQNLKGPQPHLDVSKIAVEWGGGGGHPGAAGFVCDELPKCLGGV